MREHRKAMDARIPRRPEWDAIKSRERQASMATVIELPRRTRDGSITPAQVQEVRDLITSGQVKPREAVVVCEGVEKEATARNRARALATMYAEKFEAEDNEAHDADVDAEEDEPRPAFQPLRAHAIKVGETFTGAVSVRPVGDTDADE